MSVFLDISAALDARLATVLGSPPIAWENKKYDPTLGTLFLRPTLLPADTAGATMGSSGTDEHIGIYQIDVFSAADIGKNAALVMADTVANHFKPVTELEYNSRMVRCVSVSRTAARIDGDWFMVPMTVSYLSFTTKR